ncbi:uncharacterized protein LOC117791540 isoform X2 [Drosophila innubila]|uniref:uncharacterized protein LOC117791540 isoform X2 n=1 Tax=Drosophila innubila TaxID=198719 RepID=UPI00148D2304|nr:uncharacterized protein LOC117791540 isoform X2 [Drosophila innubila]
MFGSLFSDRYNRKRDIFYAQYEATRLRFPNLPFYGRPKEPLKSRSPKRSQKKRRHEDYDYDEWIAGNFVPIVVRRTVEQWSRSQLMDLAPSQGIDVCSWRSWPREVGEEEQSLRRSLRLTDKPNLKQKLIGNSEQLDTRLAIKLQQRLPPLETGINYGNTAGVELEATFIDGCRHDSKLLCNMCGTHFGKSSDLQLHSLDDCRKNLLATLSN